MDRISYVSKVYEDLDSHEAVCNDSYNQKAFLLAITSRKWRNYYQNLAEKKQMKEKAKDEKRLIRLEETAEKEKLKAARAKRHLFLLAL